MFFGDLGIQNDRQISAAPLQKCRRCSNGALACACVNTSSKCTKIRCGWGKGRGERNWETQVSPNFMFTHAHTDPFSFVRTDSPAWAAE